MTSSSTLAPDGAGAVSDYGDGCAEFYDELYAPLPAAIVEMFVSMAGAGSVLDAGSGTGRLLLPLALRGVSAHGIEASQAMVRAMRDKTGGESLPVTVGDFSEVNAQGGPFELVTCLVNTLALLRDESAQQRAIARLAGVLSTTGRLLVETTPGDVAASRHTDVTVLTRAGMRRYSASLCPVAVASLDQWAHDAGLTLAARWRDWSRRPYQHGSTSAISIYRRIDERGAATSP
jgi:SAM-dependent methyltransferase